MRALPLSAVFVTIAMACHAGNSIPVPPSVEMSNSETSRSETRAFVGLNWTFGTGRSSAEGVLGVARVTSDSDGDAHGGKLSLHLPIDNGIRFGSAKLTGMTGQTDAMVEAGIGFGSEVGLFGTAGLWAPYVNLGLDAYLSGGVGGYAGFHTLGEWDEPEPEVESQLILN